MGVRLAIIVTGAAIALTACFGGDDKAGVLVGVWPANIEREFVDDAVGSGFFDAPSAQCVLELVQREITLEQYQQSQREEAAGMQNPRYADVFGAALVQCTILRAKEETNHGYAAPPSALAASFALEGVEPGSPPRGRDVG